MKKFLLSLFLVLAMVLVAVATAGQRIQRGWVIAELASSLALLNQAQTQANESSPPACGPPSYSCSSDGTDPKPLCTDCRLVPVPDMSAQPNAVWFDKIFSTRGDGNQVVRCSYPGMAGNNASFNIGSGGSGDSNVIGKAGGSPLTYRLIIGAYPFTYTPDPVHPTCEPTYRPIESYPVGDGSFSWVTPHLYYFFGAYNFKIKTLDLGSPTPPKPNPIADFRQILPRTGPDWPGPDHATELGTIIQPRSNNPGKYLYQATCPPKETACSPGKTGATVPTFKQNLLGKMVDGTVLWRNIGVGFKNSATWTVVGGVSTDDDVFVKAFSDAGGQGGPGSIFVAAYKRSANTFYLYNVGTGIISYFKCVGGSDFTCSGGHWTETILGMTSLPDRYVLHNVKINKNGQWVVIVQEDCRFDTCSVVPGSYGPYLWQISTTEAKVNKITSRPYGHWTEGFSLFANADADPGVRMTGRTFAKPEDRFSLNHGYMPKIVAEGFDIHPSWNYNDGSDTTPICTATAAMDWPYATPWENEVICYGTNPEPSCASSGHALCRTVVKRFFHTYNPGTCNQEDGFWGCWGIGAFSQDGKYYAVTSNWADTLGSTSQGGHGPGSCRGGFNFQRNHAYQVGEVFEPSNGTNPHPNSGFNVFKVTVAGSSSDYPKGAWPSGWSSRQNARQGYHRVGDLILPHVHNPCNHAFQVSVGGSANGSKPPDWQKAYGYRDSCRAVTTGEKIEDGKITWTDMGEYVLGTMHLAGLGRDDCRSDVFIGALN
jgi:hypothetical protein